MIWFLGSIPASLKADLQRDRGYNADMRTMYGTSHELFRPFTVREEVREMACGGRCRRSLMFKKCLNVSGYELF
jgi:hypothetical protein